LLAGVIAAVGGLIPWLWVAKVLLLSVIVATELVITVAVMARYARWYNKGWKNGAQPEVLGEAVGAVLPIPIGIFFAIDYFLFPLIVEW
jgi:hypothetical protein